MSTEIAVVDRHDTRIMASLEDAPVYRKQGKVLATIAKGGEVVETKLADGSVETRNTANAGDAIVTNPGGEQYIIKATTFEKRYESAPGQPGVFVAKGHCRAIDNPWGKPITMMASWGEMQNGQGNCKIADTYDPETGALGGQPYIIGLKEFNETYLPA